jgi:hypothetical protein
LATASAESTGSGISAPVTLGLWDVALVPALMTYGFDTAPKTIGRSVMTFIAVWVATEDMVATCVTFC